jgi:phage baseplate assembly protein W
MADIEEIYLTDIKHEDDFERNSSGNLELISGLDNVKAALFRRLITSKGTIIHRPEYGVGIKDYQNAPATLDTKRKLALEIQEQFLRDVRVESVDGVTMETDDFSPEKTTIKVTVSLVGYGETEMEFQPFGE